MGYLDASESASVGETPVTDIVALLRSRAAQKAEATVYTFLADGEIDRPSGLTFAELDHRARAIAARLQAMAAPGQRALLLYPPGLDYIEAFFGCLYGGIIAVPAYPPSRQHLARLRAVIADAAPSLIMTTAELAAKFRDSFIGRAINTASGSASYQWLATDTLASDGAQGWQPPALTPDDLAFLQYTSGSTGDPKGVMVSHGNLLANQAAIKRHFGHTESSTVVGWLPLYHDMGLIGNILQPLYLGSSAVLMSPLAFLAKPVRWLKAISVYQAATSGGPNFAYDLCVRKISAEQKRDLDLSAWILAFNGAEPVRAATMERFAQAFADSGFRRESFFPCYGLAEATLFVAGTPLQATGSMLPHNGGVEPKAKFNGKVRPVSCGFAAADHGIRIVHPETGEPCREGEIGEIWVSGPSVAQGYWNRPEESENTFRARLQASLPSAGGRPGKGANDLGFGLQSSVPFLRTGDLGFITAGQLHISGRSKDLIIIRGRNYYPQDIEQTLTERLEALRPDCCAAFGVTREGEEGVVVVAEVTRDAHRRKIFEPIIATMHQCLAEEWELSAIDLVLAPPGAVPKTSSGKLRRSACKQSYENGDLPVLAHAGEQIHSSGRASGELTPQGTGQPEKERYGALSQESAPEFQLLQAALKAVPQAQRGPLIARFIRTQASRLLGVEETALASELPLRSWGLDSLKLVEIKHAADQLLGIEAPLSLFLSDHTLAEVAVALAGDIREQGLEPNGRGRPPSTVAASSPSLERCGLSSTQRSMWSVQQLEPNSIVYNLHLALGIEGIVDQELLWQAFHLLVERHGMLRTIYRAKDKGVIQQVLPCSELPPCFTSVDAFTWSGAELQNHLAQEVREPFDLSSGPIFRVTFYHQGGGVSAPRHTLLLCAHHIAVDLWSVLILVNELRGIYAALSHGRQPALKCPAADYAAFAAWQGHYLESPAGERDWDYWRRQLAGELPVLALPADLPRPMAQEYCGASTVITLNRDATARLKERARQQGVTLFTLLLAAYKVLLYRTTHQQDLIVGVPTSGRSQGRFASVVGNFVNPLPLRSHPSGDSPFSAYLAEVNSALLGALEHQNFPFSLMVERLQAERRADHWPIYQTLFVLQQAQAGIDGELAQLALGEDSAPWDWDDWGVQSLAIEQRVENFDLKLMAAECQEGLRLSFQYRSDLFEQATIARLSRHFETLLRAITVDPEVPLGDLPLLSASERRQILVEWNGTGEFTPGLEVAALHRLFEMQVEKTPDAVAVIFGNRRLTYGELNARSNRLAHALIDAGVRPDTPVGICARRSLEMVIGLLGILKAGGAYLPLDPDYPPERLSAMVTDAQASWILAQSDCVGAFPDFTGTLWTLDANEERHWSEGQPEHNPHVGIDGEMLAYVLFTSGSTGRPKGVGIPHQGIGNRLLWMQDYFRLDASDRVLQKTPYTFDVSVWEFFWPLITGARLILAAPGDHREPERLVDLIERHGVTTLHFVPSMLNAFLEAADFDRCASLRRVICSGEALTPDLRDRFFQRSQAELHNLYGPTEASVDVTAQSCERKRSEAPVPIGRPIANTRIHLLDRRLNPVPVGVAGELYIGGVQLARGYLNWPDLTAERFLPDPLGAPGERLYRSGDLACYRGDGVIEYLGRIDHQVKIRGFRIELGEIEARLKQHPGVGEAVALAREDSPGDKRLVAYVIPSSLREEGEEGGGSPSSESLQIFLRETLPDYMVPAVFVILERLPVTANGKLDRKALPAPDFSAQLTEHYVPPRSASEETLAAIWAEVLRVERVGIHDNFFALGGDSILAIQTASRARQAGIPFTPRQLFEHQTVAELAEAAQRAGTEKSDSERQQGENQTNTGLHPKFPLAELESEELEELLSRYPDIEDLYPLAPMQEGLLFHSLLYPNSGIYLMQDRYQIEASVEVEAFQQAWQGVVDHHPILRTSFFWESQQRTHQIVHRGVQVPFEYFDWRHLSEHERTAQMNQLLADELHEGFDFARAPLFRIRLFRFGEARYWFVRSYHHVLLDEWCTSEILSHFLVNYEALIRGQDLPVWQAPPFRDYIAWLRRLDSRLAEEFWCRELEGFSEPTPLSVDRPVAENAQVVGEMDDAINFLSEADTRALTALAQRHRLTPNTFLQAAWALLLSHYSGRDEVVYGVTVAGRPAELSGVEKILGLFINSLPLRVKVAPDLCVMEFLQQLLRRNLEIRRHEHTSLVAIQSWIGIPHDRPLFDSLLVFENAPIDPDLLEKKWALNIIYEKNRTHTNYPITAVVIPGSKLHLQITYQRDRFEKASVERMLGHFKCLLEAMLRHPFARLIDLPILTEAEQYWSDEVHRGVSVPLACCDFVTGFENQAQRTPDSVAVAYADQRATYAQLNACSDRWARVLAAQGVGPDSLVALLDHRGIDFLTMMLAVFKAGGAYLPLDPAHPDGRLAQILKESQVSLLLVADSYLERARSLVEGTLPTEKAGRIDDVNFLIRVATKMVCLADLEKTSLSEKPSFALSHPARLAYVIYTSGSTGTPKGAMVDHQGMLNNLLSKIPAMGLGDTDVIAQTASQCFDISVWQFLTGLLCGARVEILPDAVVHEPRRLLQEIAARGVTVLEAVPSLIRALLDEPEATSELAGLRWLLPTGEAFPPELCRRWIESYPHVRLLNAYGPAECADDVAYHFITERPLETETVMPIGRPLANLRLYIVDRWLRPVPAGIPGELCVAGAGVGRGYLNRPDLTAERFIPNPFAVAPGERLYKTGDRARYRGDGVIEFLGRIDHQVKVRGYRVEPGEIESHLLKHPLVKQAVVVAREERGGAWRLVAYLVLEQGAETGGESIADDQAKESEAAGVASCAEAFRGFLKETLPDYMIPSLFLILKRMPLTPNGKIDRKALPEPDIGSQSEHLHVAPRNSVEERLADIWKEVLDVERVGVMDNFFDLGGHSLLAVQVLSRVRAAFGVDLALHRLFEAATVERSALLVEEEIIKKLERLSDEEAQSLLREAQGKEEKQYGEPV